MDSGSYFCLTCSARFRLTLNPWQSRQPRNYDKKKKKRKSWSGPDPIDPTVCAGPVEAARTGPIDWTYMSMTRLDQCVPTRVRKPLSQIFLTSSQVVSFSKRSFQALLIFFVRMNLRKHRFVQNSENINLFKTQKTSICSKLRKHRFVQNSENIDLFKTQKTSICSKLRNINLFKTQKTSICSKLRKHRFVQNSENIDLFKTQKTSICSKLRKHRFVQNSENIDFFKTQKTSICSKLRKHQFVQNSENIDLFKTLPTGCFDLFRDDEE